VEENAISGFSSILKKNLIRHVLEEEGGVGEEFH
jgi:hypothetical protein